MALLDTVEDVLGPYGAVLAVPGAWRFSLAGFVMRMPISMHSIGIVLLVHASTGFWALAGGVAATFILVQALASPQLARLVDRVGQARIMGPALVVHAVGVLTLVALAVTDAPAWTLFPAAIVAGAAFLPVGSMVRARWTHVLGDSSLLHTAYSFESVVDEAIFILGPVIVTLLATQITPAAGLIAALLFVTAGTLALAPQRSSQPTVHRHDTRSVGSAMRVPGLVVLSLVFVGVGAIFGSVEVTIVAFTKERDAVEGAAVVLGLFAAGSLISGLLYGARHWSAPLHRRYVLAVGALGLSTVAFPLVDHVSTLAVCTFLAGFAISPTIIAGYGLVQALVPPAALTEGLTWATTGMGIGVAIGSSVVGPIIDRAGASTAFLAAPAAGLLALLLALAGSRWLQASDESSPMAAESQDATVSGNR